MLNVSAEVQVLRLSTEKIIELIHQTRNDLITSHLEDEAIQAYFNSHFHLGKVSAIKVEFLKRDLKELLSTPVDLVHYAAAIKEIKEFNNVTLISNHHQTFMQEIDTLFKKYIF
jgi:hypothetical protein